MSDILTFGIDVVLCAVISLGFISFIGLLVLCFAHYVYKIADYLGWL